MRARLALALVATAMLACAAPAVASTTFGANLNDGYVGHFSSCSARPYTTSGADAPGCTSVVVADNNGGSAAVPVSGVVTSFAVRLQEGLTGHLRALHDPGGGAQNFGVTEPMTYFATGPDVTVPGDGQVHMYPVRIPVAAGDFIGFGSASGYIWRQSLNAHAGARVYKDTPDGTSPNEAQIAASDASSFQSPLSGVVEPDADGDGYGDETQDQCPAVTGPGACPSGTPAPGGGQPGGGQPQDTTKPAISSYVISPSSFIAANSGPSAVAAAKVGATVVYKLSEPAVVKFTAERKRPGIKKNGRCVAGKRRKGRKPCTRYVPVAGSFTNTGGAGLNSFKFMGRMGGHALSRGNYRLVAQAADGSSNRSRKSRRPFRILR